jgi:uncharacterized protein (DUF362 family)
MYCDRRAFLRLGVSAAAGLPFALAFGEEQPAVASPLSGARGAAKVAVVRCRSYGPEVRTALNEAFDLLGGIGGLVKGKTVTVKINLTGTNFSAYLDRPVGETYMTHYATALALTSLLFGAGARRVRFVESTTSRARLETSLGLADWDLGALRALGEVEFENTRNLGAGKAYAQMAVPTGGYMFSSFQFNHAYHDTDVLVSLAKLKQHITAGVTCSMKNLFGITPNSLYGGQAGSEDALDGRGPLHSPFGNEKIKLPGLRTGSHPTDPGVRVPRIVTDVCTARPIHLAIVDGITSMNGGEGPWCRDVVEIKMTTPGVIIAGLNPVSTDAVCTAIMGFPNPRATRGTPPFEHCENHILLAEQAGLGVADLAQIDVRGLPLDKARHPYTAAARRADA